MSWSFWEKETFIKEPDVTIIGSGIVGLNAAYALKKRNPSLQILVLERGILPYGASTRNAGFACYGSISELLSDLKKNSEREVFDLVEKRFKGLQRLKEIIGETNMDYEPLGGYEIFTKEQGQLAKECTNSIEYFNTEVRRITGIKETYHSANEMIHGFGFKGVQNMIHNTGEGQIDTGKMMKVLLTKCQQEGVEILNGVFVSNIINEETGIRIEIENGFQIQSKKVLIATNGFAKQFLDQYDVEPARAQVLITDPIPGLKLKGSFHYDEGYYYFRNIGSRILFGGGRNLDFKKENTTEFGLTQLVQNSLEKILREIILPETEFKVDMRWSGIMGIGNQKSPIIKKIRDNVYCCVRMGGMGIAIGSIVGEEAAEMILKSS